MTDTDSTNVSSTTHEAFRYTAFVRYCHREPDRTWAHWLQEAIEVFKTPPALTSKGYASRLGTVFVDDTEMPASNDLSRRSKVALWESRFLIVVCSPSTPPQSKWVRAEISLFKHWGRHHRILTLHVEGDPANVYPPELMRWNLVRMGIAVVDRDAVQQKLSTISRHLRELE